MSVDQTTLMQHVNAQALLVRALGMQAENAALMQRGEYVKYVEGDFANIAFQMENIAREIGGC